MSVPSASKKPALVSLTERLKTEKRFQEIDQAIPYAKFIGLKTEMRPSGPVSLLPFRAENIGNSTLPAIHGGVIAAMLEHAAAIAFLWHHEKQAMPKPVSLNINYLRLARPEDIVAEGQVIREGRQTAHIAVSAWQESPEKPIATATANILLSMPEV